MPHDCITCSPVPIGLLKVEAERAFLVSGHCCCSVVALGSVGICVLDTLPCSAIRNMGVELKNKPGDATMGNCGATPQYFNQCRCNVWVMQASVDGFCIN